SVRQPLRQRQVLIVAAPEHLQELQVRRAGILDVVRQRFLDVAHVARLEIHGAGSPSGRKNRHASLPSVKILPFIGIRVPMQLAYAPGLQGHHRGRSCRYLKRARVDDADLPALVFLRGWMVHGAKRKIYGGSAKLSRGDAAVLLKRSGNGSLKDKGLSLWQV